ncbi:MAG: TolC family protein [Terracidiphilus sp.]|nr:TolC family protein [Terracidiphilus sp.]
MKQKRSFLHLVLVGLLILCIFILLAPMVHCQAAQPAPLRLTFSDAVHKALQANLNALLAGTRVDEAEGTRQRRMSAALLPRVNAQAYSNVQNRNLRAFGMSVPGLPAVVGPFSNYDVRLYAQQNVVDLQSYHAWKAGEQALETARIDERDARDLIVRTVASLYLGAQSVQARAESARSRVTDAETLLRLARDRHDAGAATGVDVLRAQVQLANDRQTQLEADNQLKQSLLALARNLGLAPSTPIELAQPLRYTELKQDSADVLVLAALATRADYLSLDSQRKALVEQQKASRARFYPKFTINGNIGELGRSIGGMTTTGAIQGQVDFTLFDRDRNGEALELAARIRRLDDQADDLRRGVDEQIREALLNLDSAQEQVAVAREGQQLAHRELFLAQDRFAAGTTNNVEVVTAQDELARAEENYILAVSRHVDAKCALARALGDAEKRTTEFMGAE